MDQQKEFLGGEAFFSKASTTETPSFKNAQSNPNKLT